MAIFFVKPCILIHLYEFKLIKQFINHYKYLIYEKAFN